MNVSVSSSNPNVAQVLQIVTITEEAVSTRADIIISAYHPNNFPPKPFSR